MRAVGVDLGGTRLRAALVEPNADQARLLAEERVELAGRTPAEIADLVQAAVKRVCTACGGGASPADIAGVGIGIAAMLRGTTGVVANAPNLGWRDVDFRSLVRARLGPRVELYNDLKAIAWGEHRFGAGRGARSMLCVYVGTGIGIGIVADERLVLGGSNVAGEIGHTKVVPGPTARLCGCGQRGCIEAYAGGANLQARVRGELGTGGMRSSAVDLAGGDPMRVHAGHIDQAAAAGDPYARALWDEVGPLLGMALANACTLLNPNRLVMGGGMWGGAPELRRRALAAFEGFISVPARETLEVVETSLGDVAGMIGAADLIARAA